MSYQPPSRCDTLIAAGFWRLKYRRTVFCPSSSQGVNVLHLNWKALRFPCSTLDKLQPRVVSYEEQVTAIREQLADLLIDEEDWNQAAKTLAGIDLDSGDWPCTPAP